MPKNIDKHIDHDTRWKEIIEQLFEYFVGFFMPDLYPLVDFEQKPEFLQQELHQIIAVPKKKGKKINDAFVKVYLKDGTNQWFLIHIEVQDKHETDFAERMFTYYYRIYDKFKIKKITAIAIFIGESVPKNYNRFSNEYFGTEVTYKYNTYIVKKQDEKSLLASKNPFAIAVLAALHILNTKENLDNRLKLKVALIKFIKKRAEERNFPEYVIVPLVQFVMNLMVLDCKRESKFQEIFYKPFQKKDKMTMTEYDKQIIDGMNLAYYGETIEQREERKAKELLEKQNRQMVLKLFYEHKWEVINIALLLGVEKEFVEKVIEEYKN
ncbi:MAG: hypothetical protein R3E32_28805 [Chitinophagales bacterium]